MGWCVSEMVKCDGDSFVCEEMGEEPNDTQNKYCCYWRFSRDDSGSEACKDHRLTEFLLKEVSV